MATHTCFDVDITDGVAHLRMNRPDRFNSMIPAFWRELPDIITGISNEASARAIVLSSEGKHYTSGMDLEVFTGSGGLASGDQPTSAAHRSESFRHLAQQAQAAFNAIEDARVPVLTAIQGGCIGGGVDMATACDMRYATEDAFFCIQEINIGMTADVGTLQRLPKLIPEGLVRELAYTGRRMGADQAKALGLVNEVYPDQSTMIDAVLGIAGEIAEKSPLAILGTKVSINYARDHTVAEGLDHIANWNAAMLDPTEMAEAFAAKAEKRPPVFADLHKVRTPFSG